MYNLLCLLLYTDTKQDLYTQHLTWTRFDPTSCLSSHLRGTCIAEAAAVNLSDRDSHNDNNPKAPKQKKEKMQNCVTQTARFHFRPFHPFSPHQSFKPPNLRDFHALNPVAFFNHFFHLHPPFFSRISKFVLRTVITRSLAPAYGKSIAMIPYRFLVEEPSSSSSSVCESR